MQTKIDKSSVFWNYLSEGQKGLIEGGIYLVEDIKKHPDVNITDYSYLVFPFAKAYEGFLKQLFRDLDFISPLEYESDHFRIGKALNPHMQRFLGKNSVYAKLVLFCGERHIADELWDVWREGRNQVFHYFPHNLKSLTLPEAENIIERFIRVMSQTVKVCRVK